MLSEHLSFSGNGCVNYDPNEAGWLSVPICDDCFVDNVPLGMPFTHGGVPFNIVDISTNGHLHFTDTPGTPETYNFGGDFDGDTDFNVAPLWSDAHTGVGVGGVVLYKSFGDKFVVIWQTVAEWNSDGSLRNTFEVVLKADGTAGAKICFCYADMNWGADAWGGQLEAGMSMGVGNGFLLAGFDRSDATWNGVGTLGNGVQHVEGHSYCWNPNYELTITPRPNARGDPHCKPIQEQATRRI